MPRTRRTALASASIAIASLLAPLSARAQSSSPPPPASAAPVDVASSSPPPAPAPNPFPVGHVIEVRLDPPLPGEDPWSMVGLHRGDALDRLTARGALRAALASGTFAEARASVVRIPGGLQLLIEGERRFRVREVAFVGVQSRPVDSARTEFGIRGGAWVTEDDVDRAVETLHGAYNNNGWTDATVTVRWRDTDDPATRVLIVEVGEGHPTIVRRIVLDGIPAEEADAVRGVLGIAQGDVANPQLARRAMDPLATELRRAGYLTVALSPIRFDPVARSLVDVVVTARTGPHYRIRWEGTAPFPETALETALRIEEERGLDPTTLNVFASRVRDFFVRRGYFDAQARYEIRTDVPGQAELRFIVNRGPAIIVRDVSFPGVVHLSAGALRDVLNELLENELPYGEYRTTTHPNDGDLAGGGGFLWVRPSQTYVPDLYVEAARRMTNRFREGGFLDPTVAPPHVERVRLPNGSTVLDIAFAVIEGPRTILDEVTFEGNDTVPSRTLVDQTELRLGVPLSSAAREAARTALIEYYREQGHLFVRVEPHTDPSPDHTHARMRFEVHEGPEVHVGRVLVRGNDRTEDWVVQQRIELQPGQLYRPSSVRATQRRLGETGFFSGVTITPIDPEVEAPVKDIVVQVIEVRPQYLELRGGFSTGEGIRAGMEYGYRDINIFGLAVTAALSVQLGYQVFIAPGDPTYAANFNALPIGDRLRRRISLSFILPAIRPLGPYWRGSIDLATSRVIERQFAIDTSGVAATLVFRPVRAYSLAFTPEFQVNSLELLGAQSVQDIIAHTPDAADRERLVRLLTLPTGTTVLGAMRVTGIIDLRDQVFNPRSGFYASVTTEILGTARPIAADRELPVQPGNTLHTIASIAGYIPLPILGIVFATNLRAGINVGLDSQCIAIHHPPQVVNGVLTPTPDTPGSQVTYTNRLFFLGGADSMRGWLQDTMVPQDVIESFQFSQDPRTGRNVLDPCSGGPLFPTNTQTTLSQTDLINATQRGGDAFINWRNELRIPIGNTGFALGAFLDLGNLWRNVANIDLKLRSAAGAGIRYITPIGPVAFDIGFNLAPQVFEIPFAFHFSIGVF